MVKYDFRLQAAVLVGCGMLGISVLRAVGCCDACVPSFGMQSVIRTIDSSVSTIIYL